MEGIHSSTRSRDLLRKIKEFTLSILEDLSEGLSPLIFIQSFRTYCTNLDSICSCRSNKPSGHEILTFQKESHVHRIDVLLRVLLIVQQLLQENKHASKRDIYYMHPLIFSDQSVVDRAINDICILLQCSRHNLNVVSVGNGLVMGWLRFFEAGRKFDCINSPNTAHTIPVLVEDVKDLVSAALYILVVEKESVFQRLENDKFCSKNRCIVITGRGYPDVPTRRFLRLLVDKLCLPVYCLVDCDPYGFDILATYRFGSMQMAYDAKFLRVPQIQWLGAFPSDSENYDLPKQCLLPLTIEDKRKTEAMLQRCYLHQEVPDWRSELELMLQRGTKFEIEALSVHSLSFLSEVYIPGVVSSSSSSSNPSKETIIPSQSILSDNPAPPTPPPPAPEASTQVSGRKSWTFLKYGLLATVTGAIGYAGYLSYKCSYEEVEQKAKSLRAAARYTPSEDAAAVEKYRGMLYSAAMTVPAKALESYLDLRKMVEEHVMEFTEPTSDKLLPDLHPQEQHVFTLVLDLNETLLYTDWKRERGWRTFKRPGVDAFLEHMAKFYEIVVYSDQMNMYVDPVCERLDPNHYIRYRLSRGATKYQDGKHYRDLSKLNRDPAKILYVSAHAFESSLQPENCVPIKPYKLETDDTALLDLIPFLEYVARNSPADIRQVLQSYERKDVAKEFLERSKEYQRRMQGQRQQGRFWWR